MTIGTKQERAIFQERVYELASNLAIRNGRKYTEEELRIHWKFGAPFPSLYYYGRHIKVSKVKWYIHNKIEFSDGIWNNDFLHGLMSHCKIKWSKSQYPTSIWHKNDVIKELIQCSPFGGEVVSSDKWNNKWKCVPSLYLKYSPDSLSFMAGLLSGAELFEHEQVRYACFKDISLPFLKERGIPIEKTIQIRAVDKMVNRHLISPFWVALFTPYMPVEIRDRWLNVKKGCNSSMYAAILWKIYVDNDFKPNGIPFLKSRRMIYYNLDKETEGEESGLKKLERMRYEKGLTGLSNNVRTAIRKWAYNESN